jgi:GntR family transcriptional regulator
MPAKPPATPSFRPLYEQIRILLTQSLVAGEWKPGEAIPSELELAARFRVSQGTVRKAIDELASEHILVRRQGKGTFVASHSEPSYQYRFLRVMPDTGEKLHPQNQFLELKRLKAGAEIATTRSCSPPPASRASPCRAWRNSAARCTASTRRSTGCA